MITGLGEFCRSVCTWEADSTGHAVGLVLGELRQQGLQRQIDQSGDQREDWQQVEEPGPAQPALQRGAFPEEGQHVEVEVPIIHVV